jgi:hypothetical protein
MYTINYSGCLVLGAFKKIDRTKERITQTLGHFVCFVFAIVRDHQF